MNKHLKFLSVGLATAFTLFFASSVFALESLSPVSTDYIPLTTVPGIFREGQVTNPVAILKNLYGFAIGIGSVIGVVMIIYAGFEYMYKESISGKSDAKQRIMNVFLGLAVILGSYILLRTINPALVNFNVNLPSGSGRVAHLSIAQNQANAANAQTQAALTQSAAIRSQITTLEGEAAAIQSRINGLAAGATADPADTVRLNAIRSEIQTRRVQDAQLRTQANVGTVTTSIDENIYARAAGVTTASSNLPVRQASATSFFNSQIAELQTLDQDNPEVRTAINQITARRDATIEEFGQQALLERALIQYRNNDEASKRSFAASLITDIRRDAETHSRRLREAGLVNEARQYAERAQTRIAALCGANLCGN